MSRILQTPLVNSISAFDPTIEKVIDFIYDDNQLIRSRAVIIDNITDETIYDKTQDGMRLSYTIPANTLSSGHQYLIQIQVFDTEGNSSNLSDAILFYCYSTPSFNFNEIENKQDYKKANITLEINYSQTEGEILKSLRFFKYAHDKSLLLHSEVFYSSSHSYEFYSLENNQTYYFRATGETAHGILLDTGYVEVNVSFNTIPANILFQLENIKSGGYIQLRMNITDIGYELKNDNYTLKDGLLTLEDNYLIYNKGFEVLNDFILFVETKKLPLRTFLTTNHNIFSLSIVEICSVYHCKLTVKNSMICQYISLPKAKLYTDDGKYLVSDNEKMIEIINTSYEDDDLVIFEVKRINGIYSLNSYYKGEKL